MRKLSFMGVRESEEWCTCVFFLCFLLFFPELEEILMYLGTYFLFLLLSLGKYNK
jgi:hypothetical protein